MSSDFQHVTLEKVRVAAQKALTAKGFHGMAQDVQIYETEALERYGRDMATLITDVLAERRDIIEIHEQWPEDWWQAFKDHWFPAWAKQRWPIRYKRVDVSRETYGPLCPHIATDENLTHVRFCQLSNADAARFVRPSDRVIE